MAQNTCKLYCEETKNLWADTPQNGISPWDDLRMGQLEVERET